jgi:hypothetical protein
LFLLFCAPLWFALTPRQVLQLPIFEEVEGSEVLIDQIDRRARFPGSYTYYPSVDSKVYACVRANPNATTAVVHFRIDCDPSTHSVPTQQPLFRSQR